MAANLHFTNVLLQRRDLRDRDPEAATSQTNINKSIAAIVTVSSTVHLLHFPKRPVGAHDQQQVEYK
jgi:hypothetical protein